MIPNKTNRRIVIAVSSLAVALIFLGAIALLVNLSWFDAPLHPELESLKEVHPVSLEHNAYPIALGFLAADDRDPRAAGEQILQSLHDRFLRRERVTLNSSEMETILGSANPEQWQAGFKGLDCNPRVDLDCADRLIAEVALANSQDARLAVLLRRYETMLRQEHLVESQERDAYTPVAPYHAILDVGRIRLAMSYRRDSTSDVLAKAADDFRFWTITLREGETLVDKMISVAGIQNTLDFLSALMRDRQLTGTDIQFIQNFLRPMTAEEADIGEAFLSEARIALLSETPPVAMDSSWFIRWTLQRNATLNELYLNTIVPMRLRSALTPEQFYRQGAYRPLNNDAREFPFSLFNLGGWIASRDATWDPEQFVARVHDEDGRISLVLLQTEMEQMPDSDVNAVLSSSRWRNPYTGDPMAYDSESHTIGFECLHTAFHPPASPDKCRITIDSDLNFRTLAEPKS